MAERKVINKFYPHDFDPSQIPKRRRPKNLQMKIRMMLPMSIRCNVCGEYMGAGKKFNSRKETVEGEDFLGLRIFRFYVRCVKCSSELTFKTDPEHSDYKTEVNCSRNFEPWKDHYEKEAEAEQNRQQFEEGDALKELETRTLDAKQEMETLDDLDEIRSMNAQNQTLSVDHLLKRLEIEEIEDEEEEEELTEEELKQLKQFDDGEIIKRIKDNDTNKKRKLGEVEKQDEKNSKSALGGSIVVINQKKKKKKLVTQSAPITVGLGLGGYESS
ncbi:splicing factor YJU2 [Acrasis kona]|uniref:Splicing factor YJU2 n=1 Tax=Acrasis kona TaxID=1008807 RepID=A0AAW2YTI8_9EUKA